MKIDPTTNLGKVASQDIEETIYNWKVFYSVAGSLYWLPLILVMGIFKDNRNSKMLYILIPLLIINFFWMLFKQLTGGNSSNSIPLEVSFYSFLIGFSIFWLTMHKFSKYHGMVKFFIYLIIVALILSIGIFTTFSDLDRTIALMFTLIILLASISLLGFVLAGKKCKNQYRPKKFMFWLAIFLSVLGILALLAYVGVGNAIMNSTMQSEDVLTVLLVGPLTGLFIFTIHLPFMIMGFTIPFYRERFCKYFGLQNIIVDNGDVLVDSQI